MSLKTTIVVSLALGFIIASSAFMPIKEDEKPKNLKVLPKTISKEDLDMVMDNFKLALGVKCGHCHAPMKDNPKKLDFASDDNPTKLEAREMMRMTAKINKKYFKKEMHDGKLTDKISCISCHNGQKEPAK